MDKKTISAFGLVLSAANTYCRTADLSAKDRKQLDKAINLIWYLKDQSESCIYNHDHFAQSSQCETHD